MLLTVISARAYILHIIITDCVYLKAQTTQSVVVCPRKATRGSDDDDGSVPLFLGASTLKERLAFYAILWLSAWSLVWGGFYVLLSRDINYIFRACHYCALYFSIATVAVSFLGRSLLLVRRDLFRPGMLRFPALCVA